MKIIVLHRSTLIEQSKEIILHKNIEIYLPFFGTWNVSNLGDDGSLSSYWSTVSEQPPETWYKNSWKWKQAFYPNNDCKISFLFGYFRSGWFAVSDSFYNNCRFFKWKNHVRWYQVTSLDLRFKFFLFVKYEVHWWME